MEKCQSCTERYPQVWFADDKSWNAVIGTEENPRGEGQMRCPECFLKEAARLRAETVITVCNYA